MEQYDSWPRIYISGLYSHDVNREYGHKYGVRLDTLTEKFIIGYSTLDIDGAGKIVKNKGYRSSDGLYELLFKKKPVNFTRDDKENNRQIILKTNPHRGYSKSNKQIDDSKMRKYETKYCPNGIGQSDLYGGG